MKRQLLLLVVAGFGCGGGDSPAVDAAPSGDGSAVDAATIDGSGAAFAITSPALVEGAPFMIVNTCDGANTSPALAWVGAPAGTMSFAVVLTDNSNGPNGLIHSVIYDIPANLTGLPEDVEKVFAPTDVPGAHQTRTLGGAAARGYFGPCPPLQDGPHIYEFALYALDAATLPGATMATTQVQAETIILQHDLATALLTGTRDR